MKGLGIGREASRYRCSRAQARSSRRSADSCRLPDLDCRRRRDTPRRSESHIAPSLVEVSAVRQLGATAYWQFA